MVYKFFRKGDRPKVSPEPHADALTVNEFFERHPDHQPEVPSPSGVAVLERDTNPTGWAWVFYEASNTGHRWWGWRAAQMADAGLLGDGVRVVKRPIPPVAREAVVTDDTCTTQYLNQGEL